MEQLLQSLKQGDMEIATLPNPLPRKGEILVRTHYSAISTGTEGKTVGDARKGYIAKAQSRKAEVAKVLDAAKTYGIADTYSMVVNKLESLQPLGYSLSGVVIALGDDVSGFTVGDRVACGGASANHAELACVPKNLCIKLPDEAPLDEAAFTTIGAIAVQGIRRAGLTLGENAVVVGLGLIGQITVRLLRAAGVKVYGIDLVPELVDIAMISGADGASLRSDEMLEEKINRFTGGNGTDAVIITAASSSTDPVELAGILCRTHGKVVIVGNVPTGFSRKQYYRKELDLLMSTSYGPGRYDANYEEKGLDYPIGQVRWTENRNMHAFVELLASRSLVLQDLISHKFPFEKAKEAFDLVVDKSALKMGVLINYDVDKDVSVPHRKASPLAKPTDAVSFIGAGSFAGNFLLPNLQDRIQFSAIATHRAHNAENVRRKFGFAEAYADAGLLLKEDAAGAVVIATRHDTHAFYALEALKAGKRVFLEKPLCLTMQDYFKFKDILQSNLPGDLMIGFNRRFAPQVVEAKGLFRDIPLAINYRINAGAVTVDSWIHDTEIGGGRILGEVCHFIDLCAFLTNSRVSSVSAIAQDSSPQHYDTFSAVLCFENGSVANLAYFSTGHKKLAKEHLEIFAGGKVAVISDFKEMTVYGTKSVKTKKQKQDKGHAAEMEAFANSVKQGLPFPIDHAAVLHATLATFALLESIKKGGISINIREFEGKWSLQKAN